MRQNGLSNSMSQIFFDESTDEIDEFLNKVNIPKLKKVRDDVMAISKQI